MRLNIFSQKPKSKQEGLLLTEKKDLVTFVYEQFKELSKRNLRVPIKLYQL